ncbi:unnamed protein product [Diatraea saccharalis]|uniref:ALMS motif domain-containing protein n=1 Tax=Diatraea saccharalis TaxID=40085 RepID=A0A9P0CAU9_9NEOP|nr:unnamed protein product [Diatraea saccharalis]
MNEDNQSQKSMDAHLDTSMNKPLSPTSSITSQRKLEWDSLADVGYANDDKKGSASSLSTLERLALKQQYSNNDTKEDTELGPPTAHSTPVDIDIKPKNKKGATRKTTKMFQKDIEIVEVNVPQSSETRTSQSINVNLTKHISFNMDKSGKLSVDNVKNDINITPNEEKMEQEVIPNMKTDKEIQTSLIKTKEKFGSSAQLKSEQYGHQKNTVLINLNTLKKRYRRKRGNVARRKLKINKMKFDINKENIPIQEKNTEQVSAAESFEYMPGHIYNQNQNNFGSTRPPNNNNDNKSSLESSRAVTTDSSKSSKHSFSKDLEKSIDLLKVALQKHYNDSELKNKLVKEVVQRLLKSRYRDDDSTTDFLSGLSFSSKKLGLGSLKPSGHLTTSTSDSNNTELKPKLPGPKKSILRLDKFNSNILASTSQSAPNLPIASSSEKLLIPNSLKQITSNTESDVSSGGKDSSDTVFLKTSSEELYQKYLEALRREEAYRKHLRDKELFLKQKLVSSDTVFKISQPDEKVNNRLKDLIKDLTRNNYDDGSGDASKLEGGSNSNLDIQRGDGFRKHRSHSVFTLSSGNSDDNRKANLKKRLQNEMKHAKPSHTMEDQHCCPHHFTASKVGVVDSSVQVNIRCNEHSMDKDMCQGHVVLPCNIHQHNREPFKNVAHVIPDDASGEIKYVCLCSQKPAVTQEVPENMLIYKCSRLTNRAVQLEDYTSKTSNTVGIQCMGNHQSTPRYDNKYEPSTSKFSDDMMSPKIQSTRSSDRSDLERMSKSSQTNIKLPKEKSNESSTSSLVEQKKCDVLAKIKNNKLQNIDSEATRCVQTEISINPRISDLSLTDVNILTDIECEKLISDQIVKCSSESDVTYSNFNKKNLDHGVKSCTKSTQENNWHNAGTTSKLNKEIQSNLELNNNKVVPDSIPEVDHLTSDNFKIPIQGTNMTLMVRIDSKTDEIKTHGVGTDNVEISEKTTCLSEECTKGVQSHAIDIFTMIGKESFTIDKQTPTERNLPRNDGYKEAFYQQCTIKPCIKSDIKSHTYPKITQINPKPFLRSNTDTERMVSTNVQTDKIDKNNFITQEDIIKVSLATKAIDSDKIKNSKVCSIKSDSQSSNELKDSSSEAQGRKSSSDDPIMDIIKDITKRYTKRDVDRIKRKKCYKEIMNVLNYLLNTEDGTDFEQLKLSDSSSTRNTDDEYSKNERNTLSAKVNPVSEESVKIEKEPLTVIKKDKKQCECSKRLQEQSASKSSEKETPLVDPPCTEDKAVQSSPRTSNRHNNYSESSEIQATTEFPSTSSESATCKVLSKIKRECEKYHQKRCKCHGAKKCEASSSTSVTCEQCKRNHHCPYKSHKCHRMKTSADKIRKKCVAYNLIIQTSDSMVSEETIVNNETKPLRNIVVKVPPKRKQYENAPFKEVYTKIEKTLPQCSPRCDPKVLRSSSLPNESEMSSFDDCMKKNKVYTVKEYLEINRPDFVQKSSHRQESLKHISEMRANQRAAQLQLLSAQLDRRPSLTSLSETELRRLAEDLGMEIRKKKIAPKFINEREMKKHSEKIYKSLPEVVQKKEEAKKENIKKTNLLMANIFKKNLQKKTLRGSVNLSNYSTIIKI